MFGTVKYVKWGCLTRRGWDSATKISYLVHLCNMSAIKNVVIASIPWYFLQSHHLYQVNHPNK